MVRRGKPSGLVLLAFVLRRSQAFHPETRPTPLTHLLLCPVRRLVCHTAHNRFTTPGSRPCSTLRVPTIATFDTDPQNVYPSCTGSKITLPPSPSRPDIIRTGVRSCNRIPRSAPKAGAGERTQLRCGVGAETGARAPRT